MCKFALFVLFMLMALPATGKDFYIAASQAGNGLGTDCASAKPYSWFNNSAWGSGPSQIGPGTTVHVCGTINGSAGQNLLAFRGSGASGAPIKLLFEPGAVLQASYFGIGGQAAIDTNGKSWLIIDGGAAHGVIRATANGSTLANQQKSLAINAGGCSNCEFRNLTIANMYVHSSASDTTNLFNDGCIFINGSQSNVSIHDNIMHDVHWCITYFFGVGDTNIRVYNNEIYNVDHAIAIGGQKSDSASNVQVYGNRIHDYANWDTGSANYFHHDGIHVYGSGSSKVSNLAIYNNEFRGAVGANITGHIFIQATAGSSNLAIYNNVFVADTVIYNGIVDVASGDNDAIYNNTFISKASGRAVCYVSNMHLSEEHFQNNVMSGCHMLISVKDVNFASGNPNHNVYASGGAAAFNCGASFFSFDKFAAWQSCVGGDTNSTWSAGAGLSELGLPEAGSAVVKKAANLTGLCSGNLSALCRDKNGHPRPANGPWDAGAYQFGSGVSAAAETIQNYSSLE